MSLATTVVQRQIRTAKSASIPGIIAKCGFMRTTSYALLFAPTEMAGGGFTHWSTLQSKGQIQHFLKHWHTAMDSQWQAGTAASILYDCHVQAGYIKFWWRKSLMAKCLRPPWFNPTTITVIQARPTSRPCLRRWLQLCHHLEAVVPHVGQWTTSSRPLRLWQEAYISPTNPRVIHHWHAGSYWLCSPLDPSRSLFS
jgi:hypothetical protein